MLLFRNKLLGRKVITKWYFSLLESNTDPGKGFQEFFIQILSKISEKYLQISYSDVDFTSIDVFDAGVTFAVWVI